MRAHAGKRAGVVGLYRNVYPDTAYARIYGRDWDRRFRQEAYQVRADQLWRYWAGNVSVTRETWEEVGPYDTSFRAYGAAISTAERNWLDFSDPYRRNPPGNSSASTSIGGRSGSPSGRTSCSPRSCAQRRTTC